MKLKVCGVRDTQMVQACQDHLVDYIGFNFVPSSKRKVTAITAQKLSHAFTGQKVGVFMDQTIEEILDTLAVVDLNIIQLHGQESPAYINQLKNRIPADREVSFWKAFSVDEHFLPQALQECGTNYDLFLFDGKAPGSGKTITADTALQNAIKTAQTLDIPYGLAGGINAQNADQKINQFPTAALLDTASGVEESGQFSREKLKKLLSTLNYDR